MRLRLLGLGLLLGVSALFGSGLLTLALYPRGSRDVPNLASQGTEYEGTRLDGPAPDFRLVDQNRAAVALSDFRGKVVALTLLDPDCTDICPIYAYHFRLAYEDLGEDADDVVFLALNANKRKTLPADVMEASKKWGVNTIPIWHYLTGSPEELEVVWKAYGLEASGRPKPDKTGELEHSPAIFVIDQIGELRWYFSTVFEGAPPPSALLVRHIQALLGDKR